jgi:uncharacterized protein
MTDVVKRISVEVMHATLREVWSVRVQLPMDQTRVADAIKLAVLSPTWPNVEIDAEQLAVFGQSVQLNTILHDGDRIEILRPLLIDPMDARRGRVEKKKR